jgi:hypothetical protein
VVEGMGVLAGSEGAEFGIAVGVATDVAAHIPIVAARYLAAGHVEVSSHV